MAMLGWNGKPRTPGGSQDDPTRLLAWQLYYDEPWKVLAARRKEALGIVQDGVKEAPNKKLFADAVREARPGIQSALHVLLGPDVEQKAAYLVELCNRNLDTFHKLLIQAGCEMLPTDAPCVEKIFAAATSKHGKIACALAAHEKIAKTHLTSLLDEEPKWRAGHHPPVTALMRRGIVSPQPQRPQLEAFGSPPLTPGESVRPHSRMPWKSTVRPDLSAKKPPPSPRDREMMSRRLRTGCQILGPPGTA
mmetsp:Transcript_110534/g.191139  ORF Transcript_110534/g.191139 Transcript_110534/m.191139 type:complete len:249 (+) Transcript_110534:25-771(+)